MFKRFFLFSLVFCGFFVIPVKAENTKVVYELHEEAQLGVYSEGSEVTLASEKKNLLIKIREENRLYEHQFEEREDYKRGQKNKFKDLNENRLSNMKVSYDGVYVSKYSPYIELSFEKGSEDKMEKAIEKLAKYDFIEKIYVQDDYRPAVHMGYLVTESGSGDYVVNDTIQGNNIRVGILDWGIVDTDNINLSNSRLVIRDEWYFIESEGEHATLMAAIIGGDDGFAPKCIMYSVQMSGNPVSEMDWLVENDVSVCNISIGDGEGSYSSSSVYLDYIAATYGMTICCAVGNGGPTGYVSNMALSNNCISVGDGDTFAVSYDNSELVPNGQIRPLICAPGAIDITGFSSPSFQGSSISAAVITGIVVLLQRYNPNYRFEFNRYRALLMVNADDIPGYDYLDNGYIEYAGAGLVNLQNCIDNFDNIHVFTNSAALGGNYSGNNMVMAPYANQRYRYCLSYTTYIDDDDNPYRTDYRYTVTDDENRIFLMEYNNTVDGFEFFSGISPRYCQITFGIRQVGTKQTSVDEKLYVGYRVVPMEEE